MPTYSVNIYNNDPLFILSGSLGGTASWTGETTPSGSATITDTGAGLQGLTLDSDNAGNETATATVSVGGDTSTAAPVYAEESWTLRDTVTGETFNIITFRVDSGPATGYYTLSEQPLIAGRSYQTLEFDTNPDVTAGDPAFNIDDYVEADTPGDVVDGTAGNDTINAAFTDIDGDSITANADTILAEAGDDIVSGSGGNDWVYGGAGADTLAGGSGNDLIYGDSGQTTSTSESLNWGAEGANGTDISAGITQDTGGMNVTASFVRGPINQSIETSGTNQYTQSGEPFDPNSALYLTSGSGSGDNATVTLDFMASAGSGLSNEVSNVAFRINDIDQGGWQDIVTITAFDAAGNPVPVTITVSGNDSLSGNTVTAGAGGDSAGEAAGSVLVEIAGPAASVVIDYDNANTGGQALWITDVHFDTIPADAAANADSIDGGAGDDTLYGDAGNDTLTGGTGADLLFGGGDGDTLVAGENDTLFGGDGDDLFVLDIPTVEGPGAIDIIGGEGDETGGDTLQLTAGVTQGDITFTNNDNAAGGLSGSFTVNGRVVTFSEIENIICFTLGAQILTPHGPRPVESLHPGDLVVTRDNGLQPIRWIGASTVPGHDRFAPVRISAHVLDGARAPLLLSPQHRVLFVGYKAELLFGTDEVLVAAKHLIDGHDVTVAPQPSVTYLHLMLDRHEVIYANGAATESFHAGDMGLSAISDAAREEVFDIFPDLRSNPDLHGPAARTCLKAREARLLIRQSATTVPVAA